MSDVWGEEHARDVGAVGAVFGYRDEGCDVADGDEAPDEDGAVHAVADGCAEKGAVGGDGHGGHGLVVFGHELVAAFVLAEVPDAHVAAPVAGYQLALVRVDYDVVDGDAVRVVALDVPAACVPNFDGACSLMSVAFSLCMRIE